MRISAHLNKQHATESARQQRKAGVQVKVVPYAGTCLSSRPGKTLVPYQYYAVESV